MPTPLIDQEVRDQIRTDLKDNLIVEAGAGTGKTTSLVDRIVELLATGKATADSVVVITFTEKAAAELSSRVREAIGLAVDGEADPDRRELLLAARKALYRAHIETVHAFATALLRERPVEAGLDPEFQVLSGLEQDLAFDAAYDEWLDRLMESEDPNVARALNLGIDLAAIRDLARMVDEHRFLLPLSPFTAPAADTDAFIARVGAMCEELRTLEPGCTDEVDQACVNLRAALELHETLADAGGSAAARERFLLKAWFQPKGKTRAGSAKRWNVDGSLARVRELSIELSEELDAFKGALRSAAMLGVLPRVGEFVRDYAAKRLADGRPDFDDLLIWARNLLRDRIEVRRYFQERFSHLLIDEFQDTDPIQVEIAMYLTSEGQDSRAWRELEPTAGKLFVVGDPKQSVYRFRRADIAIYDEVKRNVLAEGLRLIIQNFRSVDGVIAWVNRTFNRLLHEEEGVQPGNVELVPRGESASAGSFGRSPVVLLHGGEKGMKAPELRQAEASAVASLLHEAIKRDHWPIRDRATGQWKDADWGDVAILMPTRSGLDAYELALGQAGIPHRHAGSRDYFQRQEVRDLIHILRAVDDAGDGYSVVGALRSSAFGCSDADLVIHRAGDGERQGAWNYRAPVESPSPQVGAAFGVLRELWQERRRRSLAEIVRMTIDQSKLVEFALTLPDGPQAAANLLAIGEQAQSFSAAGGGGLRSFTRWLDQSTQVESQEVDAGIAEDADEVVRLMTIHGAKGLEFPIVVLGNLGSGGRNQTEPVVDEPASRLHLKVGSKKRGDFQTPGYDDRWKAEKGVQGAEEIRLLYVGATRARDHLIIPAFKAEKARGGSPLALLEDVLPEPSGHQEEVAGMWLLDATQMPEVTGEEERRGAAGEAEVAAALEARQDWEERNERLVGEAGVELPFEVASSVERSARPMTSETSSSSAALLLSEGPPIPIGDALHLVMERVSLPDAEDLDEVVAAVCVDGGLEDEADEVRELARRCLKSPTVKRAISSGTAQREVPFTTRGAEGEILTGRMDLVFKDGNEYVVVDYKTDSVEADEAGAHALEHHAGQAFAYRTGLGSAVAVSRAVFIYCRAGAEASLLTDSSDEPPRIGQVETPTESYSSWRRPAHDEIIARAGEDSTWASAEDSDEASRRINVEGINPGGADG